MEDKMQKKIILLVVAFITATVFGSVIYEAVMNKTETAIAATYEKITPEEIGRAHV